MQLPDFWENRTRAQKFSQNLSELKHTVEEWDRLDEETNTLREMVPLAEEDPELATELSTRIRNLQKNARALEIQTFFSEKYDRENAVLSIYAGAGGDDSEDWAALLLRMYSRFAEIRGWKTKLIHEHYGGQRGPGGWGIKNASLLIEGPFAYGYLKKEAGVHRLVRISPFSSQDLRHTSFTLIDVTPEMVAPDEVELDPEDLKIEFFRSSGPGGQNVNKRETAVRITHVPTGIQVASQAERSQERNREFALNVIRAKLYQRHLLEQEQEVRGIKNEKVSIEWGNQIRSYVFHPYQLVKDHRTNVETSNVAGVLDGEIDEFIEAEIKS